jgi:hypothetical protein
MLNGIFRRMDLNADSKLTFNELAEAIKPTEVYFDKAFQLDDKEPISVQ